MVRRIVLCLCLLVPGAADAVPLLINGDFSAGTGGWTVVNGGIGQGGQVEVLPGFGSQAPVSTTNFALLHTGPAANFSSTTPASISLFQEFTLPTADTVIFTFRYTPVTARFTGAAALPNELDSFLVRLTGPSSFSADLLSFDVSNPSFIPVPDAGGLLTSPSGANFFDYIGSSPLTATLVLAAGTYKLDFRVANDGDAFFDTGLIVEGVSAESSGVVAPEPTVGALIGLALLIETARRRVRRTGGNR